MPLSAADLPLLPEAYRELAIAELGWRAIDAERPDEASALPSPGPVPRVWQLTAWQDAGAWHLPEVGAALAPGRFALSGISAQDSRFATLLQRERQSAGLAVAAWLRLWRGDVEAVAAPDSAVMQSFDSLEVRERTLVLRAGAAFGLACLLRGDLSAESWDALEFLSGTAPTAGGTTVDPTLADEIARLRLLVWQAGRLQPEARIPLRAAMFAPTPEIQTQMVALVPLVGPQVPGASAQLLVVRAQIQTIVDQLPKDAPSSVLTGRFTQSIVEIIEGAGGCTLASLGAAGIAAADLVQGMMPELRPAARNALRQVLGVAVKQPIAEGIAKALAESSETYLPSDLQPKAWSAAIMADDDKAVHAMVDWAMRRGKLGVVLLAAADLTSGEAEARLRRVGAAGSLVQQAFSAAAVLATPIAT